MPHAGAWFTNGPKSKKIPAGCALGMNHSIISGCLAFPTIYPGALRRPAIQSDHERRRTYGKYRTSTQTRPSGCQAECSQFEPSLVIAHCDQVHPQSHRRRRQGSRGRGLSCRNQRDRSHCRQEHHSQEQGCPTQIPSGSCIEGATTIGTNVPVKKAHLGALFFYLGRFGSSSSEQIGWLIRPLS